VKASTFVVASFNNKFVCMYLNGGILSGNLSCVLLGSRALLVAGCSSSTKPPLPCHILAIVIHSVDTVYSSWLKRRSSKLHYLPVLAE
jgi:hypothetical protein